MNPTLRIVRAGAALVALAATACGGGASFQLTSSDNDPARLAAAFRRVAPPPAGPLNATGKPLAFLVARGKPRQLIAFDLAARKPLWRMATDVTSKVVVGGRFVAHLEGERTLVGRDVATGKQLWTRPIGGTRFIGATADADRVYYTAEDKSGDRARWVLRGVDGATGKELWKADAPGALGAPAARGGLVFSPFLKQWLAILDGKTGEQLTRIRGIDEEISFVRTTRDHVYFGSPAGVFLLDERAASGKRAQSTYGKVTLPAELARVSYGWDAFDPVQAGYSAYDRNRLLWRGEPRNGALGFADDRVVVASYRFFFGFTASSSKLEWAYSFPRVDVIGSAHLGPAIGFASMLGELGALDPATGRRTYTAKVDGQLIGATFDADGFAPADGAGEPPPSTAEALSTIAKDRDARFTEVKKFAIAQLASLEGGGSTGNLVALVTDARTPATLIDSAVESLVSKRDPAGLPALIEAISIPFDHLSGTRPRAVGALARAIAGLAGLEIDAAIRDRAVDALVAKLWTPELAVDDLAEVVRALGAIGAGAERGPLTTFVLMYRTEGAAADLAAALNAAMEVLVVHGGAAGREAVAFVAADPRSADEAAAQARRALERPAPVGAKGPDAPQARAPAPAEKPGKTGGR